MKLEFELLWGSNNDEVGVAQESILNIDNVVNVTSKELSISTYKSEDLSANNSSAIIPVSNTRCTSQGVDISSITINISEPSGHESFVKPNESSMDAGTVSNPEIKLTTEVNKDMIMKRKKHILRLKWNRDTISSIERNSKPRFSKFT